MRHISCNLAGPDPTSSPRRIDILAGELRGAPTFRARFVNVHIGSHRDTGVDAGIANGSPRPRPPAPGRGRRRRRTRRCSCSRTRPAAARGLGTTVDELAAIAEAAERAACPRHRLGFCLDTAHAWGAGIDLADPAAIDALLADFDARIGLDRLVMVHLNDSRSERGSRTDRHEHLGAGRIGPVGLGTPAPHPAIAHATVILETPGMDAGLRRDEPGPRAAPSRGEAAAGPCRPAAFALAAAPAPGRRPHDARPPRSTATARPVDLVVVGLLLSPPCCASRTS